jgi:phage tail sheath gpL-like
VGSFITNVPSDYAPPQTFHTFNYLLQAGIRRNIPLTVAFIGTKSSAGTGVVGQVYDVTDAAITDTLAGVSSEAAIMARQAMAATQLFGRGPRVLMTLINAPAGVANVQTITAVGTATADGNQKITISGRTFTVGIRSGDVQNTVALAIANTLKTRASELPVIVTVATNVVTLTHPHAGVNGGEVIVTVDQQVAGTVATVATGTPGTGAADITAGLATLAPLRYDGIVTANHTTTDVTNIGADLAVRWAPQSKTWAWYFIGERGSIGTATTLAAAANDRAIVVANYEGCPNAPGEIAVTTAVLCFSRSRPNSSFDGAVVPLYPPAIGTIYTTPETDTAIKAGLTVFTAVIDSTGAVTAARSKCVQLVTTKTTIGATPDYRNRDIAVSRTGVYIALQLEAAQSDALGPENNPDGIGQQSSIPLLKSLAAAILRAEARANPPVLNKQYVEGDVEGIVVEPDDTTLGRNNVKVPYHPEIPLHQTAWVHDIIVGL